MLNRESLKIDSMNMLGKIASMPSQLREGFDLAEGAWKDSVGPRPDHVVVAGMGGSAIGGDILRLYLSDVTDIPILVCRDYRLPVFVGDGSLVVLSSYSGNTEETLSCFRDGLERRAMVRCISSGGELLDLAGKHGVPYVRIPGGYAPRAALGYSFSALLALAWSWNLCQPKREDLSESTDTLESLNRSYSSIESDDNQAVLLAERLVDLIPVIYSDNRSDAVATRWKNQFSENSKKLAFTGLLPEMNHNDIMGWQIKDPAMRAGVIFLRMPDEHPRVSARFAFVKEVVQDKAVFCEDFSGSGSSLLSRLFSIILLGDYVSLYLALARGIDPTPIATIDNLKSWLKNA
jgi:glucose/mannose-6-phosphate isomerase